jgi:hypothetical protein
MDNIKCNYQESLGVGKWSVPCNILITNTNLKIFIIKERYYGYNTIFCEEHNKKYIK